MAGPTNTQPPGFKGDKSSGGRKGGIVSSGGVNPGATDQIMESAKSAGPPQGGPAPQSGAPSPGGQAPDFFEEEGAGFGPGPQSQPLLPSDPDAKIRALYRAFPSEDLRRLLEFRTRG